MNGSDIFGLVFWPFLLSFAVSMVVTPIVIWVFRRRGFVIDPTKQNHPAHIHSMPVPKGGGIAIFLALVISAVTFLKIDQHLIAILLGSLVCVIVGVADDISPNSPYLRLMSNLLVAAMVVGGGVGIAYISNPFGGIIDLSNPKISFELWGAREIWLLADIFALVWIPFMMNSINWASGVDGQISGVVVIASIVIGILSLSFSADITQWPVAILAFALAGGFAGFTIFHFYPQKIMPGYSATSLAGFLLAVLAILATAKVGTALVVLGLPAIDAVYVGVRRIISGKSPLRGDRGHLHHGLLDMGWGKRKVALFYWLVTAMLGVTALLTNARFKLFAILGMLVVVVFFWIWSYFGQSQKQPDHVSG